MGSYNCVAAMANVVWEVNRNRDNGRTHREWITSIAITGGTGGSPTFTSLVVVHGALQMRLHSYQWAMERKSARTVGNLFALRGRGWQRVAHRPPGANAFGRHLFDPMPARRLETMTCNATEDFVVQVKGFLTW
jgi:hypothetical protein